MHHTCLLLANIICIISFVKSVNDAMVTLKKKKKEIYMIAGEHRHRGPKAVLAPFHDDILKHILS